MRSAGLLVLYLTATFATSQHPPGHLQPLGSHAPPIEISSRDTIPDPVEFFNEYVKPGVPVILRGAAKRLPNFYTWRDDEYLRQKYGNWALAFEVGKYEDASKKDRKTIVGTLRQFLKFYKTKEVYLVHFMSHENPMIKDVALPKCVSCGGFKQNATTVALFFSSGGTNTAVHKDEFNNLGCVFDGSKEWFLFDRKTFPSEYYDSPIGGYSALNTLSVDMYKYPIFEMPWYHAIANTGDCIFVPIGWPHHVLSDKRRNMGVSVWWNHMHDIDLTDCPKDLAELPDYVFLDKIEVTYRDNVRSQLLSIFLDRNDTITKAEFLSFMEGRKVPDDERKSLFEELDANRDDLLTVQEVLSSDLSMVDGEISAEFGKYKEVTEKQLNKAKEEKQRNDTKEEL